MVEIKSLAQVNKKKCIGCGICENVCPTEAIEVVNKKARIARKKCLACPNCWGVCPEDAIKLVSRSEPLRLGVDPAEVDQTALRELCVKAHLHPHQWLCLCTATRVREGAAAVFAGHRYARQIDAEVDDVPFLRERAVVPESLPPS